MPHNRYRVMALTWLLASSALHTHPSMAAAPDPQSPPPLSAPTSTPTPTAPPQASAQHSQNPQAEWDALLAAQNWAGLKTALTQPANGTQLEERMSWMEKRLQDGKANFFVAMLHAQDLMNVGTALNVTDPTKDMRVTASMIALYTLELIQIDGAQCADVSAPSHRMQQAVAALQPILAFLKKQSATTKENVVKIAVALEAHTAKLRPQDDLVCRGGSSEIQAGLKNGAHADSPAAPGSVGKTVSVEPPPGWKPTFLPPQTYQPIQEKRRAALPQALEQAIQ